MRKRGHVRADIKESRDSRPNELQATIQYGKKLREIFRERGLLATAVYEVKSTLYSLVARIQRHMNYVYEKIDGIGGDNEGYREFLKKDRAEYILRGKRDSPGDLWHGVCSVVSLLGFLSGLFFLSPNLTGNAIGNISNSTSSVIGACLLVVGLLAGFFLMKGKRK